MAIEVSRSWEDSCSSRSIYMRLEVVDGGEIKAVTAHHSGGFLAVRGTGPGRTTNRQEVTIPVIGGHAWPSIDAAAKEMAKRVKHVDWQGMARELYRAISSEASCS